MATPQDILNLIKEKDIQMVDLKFVDLLGTWQQSQADLSQPLVMNLLPHEEVAAILE